MKLHELIGIIDKDTKVSIRTNKDVIVCELASMTYLPYLAAHREVISIKPLADEEDTLLIIVKP